MKRHGCLFTCFATRAVHLEVCNSLSTNSFMRALERFLRSRGFSTQQVWSDHGTNLVGASNEIKQVLENLDENKIARSLSSRGVKWKFSPTRSPHQSGVWEVMIREVKRLLKAIDNDHCYRVLNGEECLTFVKEVEGIITCRPLTPLSDDPEDFSCLSPMSILNMYIKGGEPAACLSFECDPRQNSVKFTTNWWNRIREDFFKLFHIHLHAVFVA